jgi:hypothetical protein
MMFMNIIIRRKRENDNEEKMLENEDINNTSFILDMGT